MALQVWMPFSSDKNNYGLADTTVSAGANAALVSDGKIGKSLSSSTASNYTITVTVPGLASMLANGKKYSLACWVKLSGRSENDWCIKLGTNTCGLWRGKATGDPRWVWNENDSGKRSADTVTGADDGVWHHLASVVDKSVSGKCTTYHYVDGELAHDDTLANPRTWDNSSQSQPAGETITIYPYVAQLNDVRFYDHALSAREVKELSKALTVHYPLSQSNWGDGIIYDCSGYCYNAQIVGTVGNSDDAPRYLSSSSFSGTGAINCGHAFDVQQAKNVSFCCWAKADDWTSTGTKYFISSQEAGGILLGYNPSDSYIFGRVSVYTNSGHTERAYFTAQTGTHKALSGWHFFACTYDGSSSASTKLKTYLDGVKIAESTMASYGLQFNTSANMYIGAESAGTNYSNAFSGKVSDVRLYYTTLSDTDVLDLYNTSASIANNGALLANEFIER